MKRVLFAGDIHGNKKHAQWLFNHASKNEVDIIIACGDFGYWTHMKHGQTFVKFVADRAETLGIKFMWVDGNHENHDILDDLVRANGRNNPIPTPNEWLQYIPRGCRFDVEGHTFMGYGGAWSVDWEHRELGISWWKQELVSPYHMDAYVSDEPVDVLITHEAPYGKEISYKDEIEISVGQRELILELQNKVNPNLHVCGHHHTRENWQSGITDVHVLGRDTMEDESVLIVDFERKESSFSDFTEEREYAIVG